MRNFFHLHGTVALASAISFFTIVAQIWPQSIKVFALIPGNTFGYYYIWNGITAGLYHDSFLKSLFNLGLIVSLGRILEPLWKTRKLLRVVFLSLVTGFFAVFVLRYFEYVKTLDAEILYSHPVCGSSGILAAFIVGLKQEFPGKIISRTTFTKFFRSYSRVNSSDDNGDDGGNEYSSSGSDYESASGIRTDSLPFFLCLFFLLFGGFFGFFSDFPFVISSTCVTWLYLRYFCRNLDGSTGDMRTDFSFTSFFPNKPFVQKPLKMLAKICAAICDTIGILPKSRLGGKGYSTNRKGRLKGGLRNASEQRAITERRRARALKALDEKLAEIASLPDTPLDSLGDLSDDLEKALD
eukprot:g5906.t1